MEPKELTKERYSIKDIMKFSDGWWITFWDVSQKRVIKASGPYKMKDEAKCDMMVLNARAVKSTKLCYKTDKECKHNCSGLCRDSF